MLPLEQADREDPGVLGIPIEFVGFGTEAIGGGEQQRDCGNELDERPAMGPAHVGVSGDGENAKHTGKSSFFGRRGGN